MTEISDAGRKLAEHYVPELDVWEIRSQRQVIHLATDHLALKAEHEKAVADLRLTDSFLQAGKSSDILAAKGITAKYRETDPLVEAFQACWPGKPYPEASVDVLRARLKSLGFELARVKP